MEKKFHFVDCIFHMTCISCTRGEIISAKTNDCNHLAMASRAEITPLLRCCSQRTVFVLLLRTRKGELVAEGFIYSFQGLKFQLHSTFICYWQQILSHCCEHLGQMHNIRWPTIENSIFSPFISIAIYWQDLLFLGGLPVLTEKHMVCPPIAEASHSCDIQCQASVSHD